MPTWLLGGRRARFRFPVDATSRQDASDLWHVLRPMKSCEFRLFPRKPEPSSGKRGGDARSRCFWKSDWTSPESRVVTVELREDCDLDTDPGRPPPGGEELAQLGSGQMGRREKCSFRHVPWCQACSLLMSLMGSVCLAVCRKRLTSPAVRQAGLRS